MQLCTFYYALFRSGVVSRIRIGLVEQLNYLPLCYALKEGPALGVKLVKDSPTSLNKLFLRGKLDVTPLSLIEYARNMDFCQPLQNFSITTEGKVPRTLLFSKLPVTELERKQISLNSSSATAMGLLKILCDHYYHVDVEFVMTSSADLADMMARSDGALLTEEDALLAVQRVNEEQLPYYVTDLDAAWREFTGETMVCTLWVIRKLATEDDNTGLIARLNTILEEAKSMALKSLPAIITKASKKTGLPAHELEAYYNEISYGFSEESPG
jgi:chorismate dehydratase